MGAGEAVGSRSRASAPWLVPRGLVLAWFATLLGPAACSADDGGDSASNPPVVRGEPGTEVGDGAPAEASAEDAASAEGSSADGEASADDAAASDAMPDASLDAPPIEGGVTSDAGDEPAGDGAEAGWGTCSVLGVAGDCVDTAECAQIADHRSTAGHCPGPANIQCCTPYGAALCDPTIVRRPNGGITTEAPGVGGCPAGMLRVDTFCIDRYEASLVVTSDGSSWSPYLNPGPTRVRAVSVKGAVPQGYISGTQAGAACANAGKRLCTDAEWLRACKGPSGTTYPYGGTLQLGVCNDHRAEHPAIEYFGTNASWIFSHLDDACLNQLPLSVDAAGSLPGCVTAEGAFDMMGNLHEWTADPAGTFRGGFYVDTVINGLGCDYVTTAHDASYWDYSTGFRCCAD